MKIPKLAFEERQIPKLNITSRLVTAPVAVTIVAAVVAFVVYWIGNYANPPKFDWSAAADAGTAVGTTLLALATVWLALEARAEREHTTKIVKFQERDEERKDRAWVAVLGAEADFPSGAANPVGARAHVRVANAGQGPALEVAVVLSVWGDRQRGSGKSTIGIKVIPLIMPMSTEEIIIEPLSESSPIFNRDVKELTCIDIQYRDKLTMSGAFREADPFWDIKAQHRMRVQYSPGQAHPRDETNSGPA